MLFCACALLLLFPLASLNALTPSEQKLWQSTIEDIRLARLSLQECRQLLADSKSNLAALSQQLSQARRRLTTLDSKLQLWQEYSEEVTTSLETFSSELGTLRRELTTLTDTYNALSTLHSKYVSTAEARVSVLEKSARTWRVVAVAGGIGALAAGFLAGLLVGK